MDELQLFRGDTVLLKGKRRKETVSSGEPQMLLKMFVLKIKDSVASKCQMYCPMILFNKTSREKFKLLKNWNITFPTHVQ